MRKFNFVSPEQVYAKVKEELKSYFDTGIIDDLLFPRYTDYCLRKMGRATYKISETPLEIKNYQADLPDGFFAVRELWGCTNVTKGPIKDTHVEYSQITTRVTPLIDKCEDCIEQDVKTTFKTTGEIIMTYNYSMLLTPGNVNAREHCSNDCANLGSNSLDTFDIRDNKLIVNFSEGTVHMVYYKTETDENEDQMIPDIIEFEDMLEHYIKFKCFEQIFNSTTDETFNQVNLKYQMYKQLYEEKFIICRSALRAQTIYDVVKSIKKQKHRFDKYEAMMGGRYGSYNFNKRW